MKETDSFEMKFDIEKKIEIVKFLSVSFLYNLYKYNGYK